MTDEIRTESDSMGELEVPAEALWGAQTQRAVENFPISGLTMPPGFVRALGLIKACAAHVNADLGLLPAETALHIVTASEHVAAGEVNEHFPVDVFQTGSGTSSNMNANEVIAALASRESADTVHPNDHVNYGQSSNDVIPTAIHLSAVLAAREELLPSLEHLASTLRARARELADVVKTGRTHLMDAMPVRMDQEIGAWASQIEHGMSRVEGALPRCQQLAQGGTAVGTGVNAHPEFGARFAERMRDVTGIDFQAGGDYCEGLASQDAAVELSGQLKVVAVSLMKIANDLRWMNSGPLAGIGEISLPALQPGSSIMPGKVNPVIPESVAMVCAQVIGNDATITVAGQSGNFQLNVMLPVIGYNLLQSIELLANSSRALADKAIADFTVNHESIAERVGRNPILVTALNAVIGYDQGAAIAKAAYAEGRSVIDVALEQTDLSRKELEAYLNPADLTEPKAPG
ncbi:MAG: class II fumarate hydratase [Gammaproteobacteria bacterium]|nr:class II fumarate hydratase [Gammaproteobacteria bacterium]